MGQGALCSCPMPDFPLWLRPVLVPKEGEREHTQAPCHETQVYQQKGGEVGRGQSLLSHQSDVDFCAQADVEGSR